jgi:hypothetical protein
VWQTGVKIITILNIEGIISQICPDRLEGQGMRETVYLFEEGERYSIKSMEPNLTCDAFGRIISIEHSNSLSGFQGAILSVQDRRGKLLWVRKIEGFTISYPKPVQCDMSGNIYLTGSFKDGISYKPGVQKYGFSGDLLWSRIIPVNRSYKYSRTHSAVSEGGDIFTASEISGDQWSLVYLARISQSGEDMPV